MNKYRNKNKTLTLLIKYLELRQAINNFFFQIFMSPGALNSSFDHSPLKTSVIYLFSNVPEIEPKLQLNLHWIYKLQYYILKASYSANQILIQRDTKKSGCCWPEEN